MTATDGLSESRTGPRLSFLLTNLNGARQLERTLPRLIEVVGDETFRSEYELVVVDAGSADDSLSVLDRFSKQHGNCRVQSEMRPCSRGRGRQLAFKLSRGTYVAILDSDLRVRPAYGPFLQGYLRHPRRDESAFLAYEDMDGRRANLTCSFYPRSLIDQVGGWRDLWGAEDIDLWVRLIRASALTFLPACLGDDLEDAKPPSGTSPTSFRTQRERRYAGGVAFYRRWVRQTNGRFVAFGYSLPEKIRADWAGQPRWTNRLADLFGSSLARLAFYAGHPEVVRLSPEHHNGIELHRHLLTHRARPSEFGLDDRIEELRVNPTVRALLAHGSLPPKVGAFCASLALQDRLLETDD